MSAIGRQLEKLELNSKVVALMGARQFLDDQINELNEKIKQIEETQNEKHS